MRMGVVALVGGRTDGRTDRGALLEKGRKEEEEEEKTVASERESLSYLPTDPPTHAVKIPPPDHSFPICTSTRTDLP